MSVSNSTYYEHKATVEKLLNVARDHFATVDNKPRYEPVSNPWDLKINAEKPVLDNPNDPNRPLQAQVKGPEVTRRKRRP